jgi:hypothetical protein
MKILYIPLDFHRHTESPELFSDLVKALKGEIYQSREQAINFKPDVVLFHGGLTPNELYGLKKDLHVPILMWTGDCRYMPQPSLMMYKDVVDAFILPFSGKAKQRHSKLIGKPCYFLWEPIQNWRFKKPQELLEGPVTFVGNLYETLPGGETRQEIISFINTYANDLRVYGNFPGCSSLDNNLLPERYNNSYAVIAENNLHDIDDYFTPRNIGAMAAGSCVAMRYFPNIEEYFVDGKDCFVYRHKYELLDIIQFLQRNPVIRNRVASDGYYTALSYFSLDNFATEFKNIVNSL